MQLNYLAAEKMEDEILDVEKYSERYVAKLQNEFEQQLELNNQKIHELQRDLSRATAVERDYIQEIEILQNVENTECKKLMERIQGLEDTCHALRENRKDDLAMLEAELNTKSEENRLLIEKTEDLQRIADNVNVNDETQKLVGENSILRNRIEILEKNSANMRATLEEFQSQRKSMERELNIKNTEMADLQENYAVKSQELKSTKEKMETLTEELVNIRNDFDLLKNKPVDHVVQGNSLFAEVNDRRVQLQQNMDIMKEHYVEMKKERINLLQKVNNLQSENVVLAHRVQQDVVEMEKIYCLELGLLRQRVKTQENVIEGYKEKVDQKKAELAKITTVQHMEDFFSGIVKSKDEEIENLMRKLDMESMSGMTLFNNMRISKRELGASKLALQQSLNENTKLRTDMELMRLNDPELRRPCQECAKRKHRFALPHDKFSGSRPKEEVPEAKQNKMYVGDFLKSVKEKRENKQENDSPAHQKESNIAELLTGAANDDDDDKENTDSPSPGDKHVVAPATVRKGVRFTEDTVDPKTDKKHYRPRGKILTCPVTYVTCKKKQ